MTHPELENLPSAKNLFFQGMANFLTSSVLYSVAFWYAFKTLEGADAISFKFSWIQSSSLVTAVMFCRIWDRAFIKR